MALPAGARLGPYEILAPIGAGGMGEVYKARDARLDRTVAIKIAKENFSERFEREARAIAALNHPNICHLYDVGANYLVMEYVEGETLSARIQEGAIPFEEAIRLARQVVDALEEAHGKGIVHRDLKPGNITIKPDGAVKVLDFGLAKMGAIPSAPSEDSPTVSMAATQAGVVLGTASYMSPEQARGKAVDKRADIWAFGAVLYEMLTGRRLFHGEDVSQILASVIKEEPSFDLVPAQVRKLLKCCLEKDPKNRLRDIGDAWILLGEQESQPAAKKSWAGWVAAAALLAVSIGLGLRLWRPASEIQPIQMELTPPNGVTLGQFDFAMEAVSPDGRRVVFYGAGKDGKRMLWMRNFDAATATPVSGSEGAAGQPFWSPDSKWIAFMAGGSCKK